jgi:hypothetical protein
LKFKGSEIFLSTRGALVGGRIALPKQDEQLVIIARNPVYWQVLSDSESRSISGDFDDLIAFETVQWFV